MERKQIEKKTLNVICRLLDISEKFISYDSSLKDLGADSLDQVEIVLELEKEFGVEITPNYPDEMYSHTLENLIRVIEIRLEQKQLPLC